MSCSLPHSISLRPQISRPQDSRLPPCPLEASQGRLAAQSYLPLTLEVVITDSQDRRIDSVDTVAVTWALSSPGRASLAVQGKVVVTAEDRDGVRQPGTPTQASAEIRVLPASLLTPNTPTAPPSPWPPPPRPTLLSNCTLAALSGELEDSQNNPRNDYYEYCSKPSDTFLSSAVQQLTPSTFLTSTEELTLVWWVEAAALPFTTTPAARPSPGSCQPP